MKCNEVMKERFSRERESHNSVPPQGFFSLFVLCMQLTHYPAEERLF